MPSELIPWRAEIERLRREMDQLCQRFSDLRFLRRFAQAGEWHPIIDISESESEIVVHAEIPGMEGKDIDVSLEGSVLTIRGERKREMMEKDEEVYPSERGYGAFLRSIRLPGDVDPDRAKASYSNGILRVKLPRTDKRWPRKIQITTE